MIFHFFNKDFFKKKTKHELIGLILGGVLGLIFVWIILYFREHSPVVKEILNLHEDMVQAIGLIFALLILGITYVLGLVYRRFVKGIPKCANCSNTLKKYELDLVLERIKCKTCGFQSTFYQFPDKVFLHDKFAQMLKNKNLDPIIFDKAKQIVEKFENFEFSKEINN